MKTFSKQTNKWILSTALVAALGSQYYFSISSSIVGSIDMSSTAAPSIETKGKVIIITSAAEKAKPETEARVVQITCTEGCEPFKYSGNSKDIDGLVAAMNKMSEAKPAAPKAEKLAEKSEVKKEETVAERREREREEKETEKERIKTEKEQALVDAQEDRNERFAAEVEKLTDKCEDKPERLKCVTDGFTRILSKFKAKNKVDGKVVEAAFKANIEKDLKTAFATIQSREERIVAIEASQGQTAETVQMRAELTEYKLKNLDLVNTLESKIPENYTFLKTKTLDIVKAASVAAAVAANSNYKSADALAKSKKSAESIAAYNQAQVGHQALINNAGLYKEALSNIVKDSGSSEVQNYFSTSYLTDMNRILANVQSLTNFKADSAATTSGTTINQPGTTNNRDSRSNSNGVNSQAPALNSNNGVTWGTATTSPTGTRMGAPIRQ